MTFELTFKTPGVVDNLVESLRKDQEDFARRAGNEDYECDAENLEQKVRVFLERWIRFGELVTIVFNDETNTAVVRKVG